MFYGKNVAECPAHTSVSGSSKYFFFIFPPTVTIYPTRCSDCGGKEVQVSCSTETWLIDPGLQF